MKGIMFFPVCILFAALLIMITSCSANNKLNGPMKIYSSPDIRDGEFLHWGMYNGGEKESDFYDVTRIVTNGKGGIYYRLYVDVISVKKGEKLSYEYTNWPVSCLIDPETASAIESVGNLKPDELQDFSKVGASGLVYWRYLLFPEKGLVKYTSRSVTNNINSTMTSTIKIKKGYPSTDALSKNFISYRLIDPGSGGIMYWIMPFFMKDPLPVTLRKVKKETVTVKAGKFNTYKIETSVSDRFLGSLIGEILKDASWYVEDSGRRIPVKAGGMGMEIELEEISNLVLKTPE